MPFPPTDDDDPVMVRHVICFLKTPKPRITPTEMEAYTSAAAVSAARHDVRITGWFAVEGTIVGDDRAWNQ